MMASGDQYLLLNSGGLGEGLLLGLPSPGGWPKSPSSPGYLTPCEPARKESLTRKAHWVKQNMAAPSYTFLIKGSLCKTELTHIINYQKGRQVGYIPIPGIFSGRTNPLLVKVLNSKSTPGGALVCITLGLGSGEG